MARWLAVLLVTGYCFRMGGSLHQQEHANLVRYGSNTITRISTKGLLESLIGECSQRSLTPSSVDFELSPDMKTHVLRRVTKGTDSMRVSDDSVGNLFSLRGGGPKKPAKPNQKVKKAVDDKTFGLKNKNKSKKVQQYVQGVQTAMENSMTDKKKAAEAKARQAKKDEEKRRQLEESLLFHVVPEKKDKLDPEEELKSTKQMMEEYEYQSSISALGKPISAQAGSLEEEIELARSKVLDKDKVPVTAEWFLQWAEHYNAKMARKEKLRKGGAKKLTGRELFEQQTQGEYEDDEEAEESWLEQKEDTDEEEDDDERGEGASDQGDSADGDAGTQRDQAESDDESQSSQDEQEQDGLEESEGRSTSAGAPSKNAGTAIDQELADKLKGTQIA